MKRLVVAVMVATMLSLSGCTVLFGGAGAGAGAGLGYALDSNNESDGAQAGAFIGLFIGAAIGIVYDDKVWQKLKCKIAPKSSKECARLRLEKKRH